MRSDVLRQVEAETDRIHSACDEIELAMSEVADPEEWRVALGLVDKASLRAHQTRNTMLKEARHRADLWREEVA